MDPPEGVRLRYVPQAGAHGRHERMLQDEEWDLCEFSLSTFVVARSRGRELQAIPVFPRRMFTAGLIFVRVGSEIESPADLPGKRFGIRTFQTTLSVWGLGDLATVHHVPLPEIEWVTQAQEPLPVPLPSDWTRERLPEGDSLEDALARGSLDAVLVPWVPRAAREGQARALFADPVGEQRRYVETTGVFPIMHTIVAREEVFRDHPSLPAALLRTFEEAKQVGMALYDDPGWSVLAGSHTLLAEQRAWLGDDPFPYGLPGNERVLQRLMEYQTMLGLIDGPLPLSDLFAGTGEG